MNYLRRSFARAFLGTLPALALAASLVIPAIAAAQLDDTDTDYRIDNEQIWSFFSEHGGSDLFGPPISREFTLNGQTVQLFERSAIQVGRDGAASVMPLTESGLLPYTHLAGLTVPPPDPGLAMVTPRPEQLNYTSRLREFIRATVPETWNGQPVRFYSTVTVDGLDVWGTPTSGPATDPHNPGFVYQRFQNGILLFDATNGSVTPLPMGAYLKAVLTAQNLPTDLGLDAAQSALLGQYDASKPLGVAKPALLPGSDLTDAFAPDAQAATP